jgi:hypothetical protein
VSDKPLRSLVRRREWFAYLVFFHVVAWVSILVSTRDWVGSWKMAYDWASGTLLIVGPIVGALSAITYAHMRRTSTLSLMAASTRRVAILLPAASLWLIYVLSTALVMSEMTALAVVKHVPVIPAQLANLPFLAALSFAQVAIGAYIGLLFREVWAGILAIVVLFLASILASVHFLPQVFVPGSTTGSLVGQEYRLSAMAILALSSIGLAVIACVALFRQVGMVGRLSSTVALVVGVALFCVGYAPNLNLDGRLKYVDVQFDCEGEAPSLCVASETPLPARPGSEELGRLAKPLVSIGVKLPSRWFEQIPGRRGPDDTGMFIFTNASDSSGRLRREDAVLALTLPAQCKFDQYEPEGSIDSRRLLATWIAVRNDFDVTVDRPTAKWARSADSDSWVRATYGHLRSCKLSQLGLPQ